MAEVFTHIQTQTKRLSLYLCLLSFLAIPLVGSAAGCDGMSCGPGTVCQNGQCVNAAEINTMGSKSPNINLLQPLDGSTTSLPPESGLGTFFTYFNLAWPWVLGSAAGIAVLWSLIGGAWQFTDYTYTAASAPAG